MFSLFQSLAKMSWIRNSSKLAEVTVALQLPGEDSILASFSTDFIQLSIMVLKVRCASPFNMKNIMMKLSILLFPLLYYFSTFSSCITFLIQLTGQTFLLECLDNNQSDCLWAMELILNPNTGRYCFLRCCYPLMSLVMLNRELFGLTPRAELLLFVLIFRIVYICCWVPPVN